MFDHVWPSFFAEINVASLCVTLYPSPIRPLLMWSRCRSWWHLNLPQSHLGSGWANFGWRTNQQQGQMVRTSMCNKSGQNWTWKQADADLGSQVTGHRRMQLPFAVASGPHFLELGIIQGILDLCILCIFFSTKKPSIAIQCLDTDLDLPHFFRFFPWLFPVTGVTQAQDTPPCCWS